MALVSESTGSHKMQHALFDALMEFVLTLYEATGRHCVEAIEIPADVAVRCGLPADKDSIVHTVSGSVQIRVRKIRRDG